MLPPRKHKNSGKQDERKRSPAHRSWIRGFECSNPKCITPDEPIECAHVRIGSGGGMGMKPSDAWCIALCRICHARSHNVGDQTFMQETGLGLVELAQAFYRASPHKVKLDDPWR